MSADTETAQNANQADANSGRSPYDDYVKAAGAVVQTIGTRDETHGDPEAFGVTFARFLNAYLGPIVAAGRALGPADAFVVLDLMKTARISVGGVHPDHFLDKAGYGLLGMVHVARAFSAVQDARQDSPDAPEAPESPEPGPTPQDTPRGARKPAPDDIRAALAEEARQGTYQAEPGATDQDDDDADLLRWALDPASDPFADLMTREGDADRLRPGVTLTDVMARQGRILVLLRTFVPATPAEMEAKSVALAKYGERTKDPLPDNATQAA